MIRQRNPNGRFPSSHAVVTAALTQSPFPFLSLPIELRLTVYAYVFSNRRKRTLRRLEDLTNQRQPSEIQKIKLFSTAILTTCKTICAEALPAFYTSQTFHYSAERDGLFRQPTIPAQCMKWVKYLSLDITTEAGNGVDGILATHVRNIVTHCIKLVSFTLHIPVLAYKTTIPLSQLQSKLTQKSATAKALRALRARVDRLSIVTLNPPNGLLGLRRGIVNVDSAWVTETFSEWPRMKLPRRLQGANAKPGTVPFGLRRHSLAGFYFSEADHISAFHIYGPHVTRRLEEGGSLGEGDWLFK
ncbi:hypothetical protein HO133_006889 [Letharia lupina]|uniref:DUF7730 domain-containing protein n=1 Tax=Letharia lupina TaxID=560253 RepID=A0A8H6F746_9LECA|nr:uncharacterized protein HO133_006889 [Letharia lupina]KAF6217551.1 hypothetical protein HO133_006889 [Letharia lupina]